MNQHQRHQPNHQHQQNKMNQDDLKIYIEALDPELKDFLKKEEWRKKLRKICSDYAVRDEQLLTSIENEIFLIMIGIEFVGNLVSLLTNAGVPKIQAEPLSEAIAKDVLFDIAEFLSAEEVPLELPDGAGGSISKDETVVKNPIISTPTPAKAVPVNIKPSPNTQQVQKNVTQPTQINQAPKTTPHPTTNNSQLATPTTLSPKNLQGQANLSWEERKKRAEEALKKVVPPEVKKYPGAADPYREPIQ